MTRLEEVQAKLAACGVDERGGPGHGGAQQTRQLHLAHRGAISTWSPPRRRRGPGGGERRRQWVLTGNIEAGGWLTRSCGLPFELLADNWHDRDDAAALARLETGAVATDTSWPEGPAT